MELNLKYNPEHVHSLERICELQQNLDKNGYDPKYVLFIDVSSTLMDGIHRASWLLSKYGADFEVELIVLYGDWWKPHY